MAEYIVSKADLLKDRVDTIDLWMRNASVDFTATYEWKYRNSQDRCSLHLMKTLNGEIAGCNGILYRNIKIRDGNIRAGQTIDLLVAKKHRLLGPAMRLHKSILSNLTQKDLCLIYAFPNSISEPLLLRSGYVILGPLERWTKTLFSEARIKSSFKIGLIAKPASYVLDLILRITSGEFTSRSPFVRTKEKRMDFDKRFDKFWAEASIQFGIIAERSSDYLNWRFRDSPHKTHRLFCLLDRQDDLYGYVVYYVKENSAVIVDMLALDPSALKTILMEFVKQMRIEHITSITFFYCGNKTVQATLRSIGFHRRPDEGNVLIYWNRDECQLDGVLDPAQWFITLADRDI